MKFAIILSTNNVETNWNAFRFANVALQKGDTVSIFLLGDGVEYGLVSSSQFNIKEQVEKFLPSEKAQLIACGTCLALRKQESSKECPKGSMEDWYRLVADSDRVLTF